MSVFGRCIGAAGVQGHYGEGHLHYKIPGRNPNFERMTFTSKTQTLLERSGNVKSAWYFWEFIFPSWARMHFSSRHTLNVMGLPGPGICGALQTGQWQNRTEPFGISIMAVEATLEKRLDELFRIADIIGEHKTDFIAPSIYIQLNRSCPNTGHSINVSEIVKESEKGLQILSVLGWPLQEKFAVDTAPVEAIRELQGNPYCDGICIGNTVKYNYRSLGKEIFGKDVSPLARLGGGGISGPKLLPLNCDYIKKLRDLGFEKNINGLGGIFCPDDVDRYRNAGADSVGIGTVAFYDPKQVALIIQRANSLTWRKS
ncbi:MAG: hypothetical protein A2908_00375 [Candidatus Staskawiczbacteria bacterium RIFCSPLOWO2_01_FULL_38_12b]|uniref:Dihydroorotate dehydrogenase catalytic domain-containing protein n=1 Tax=Candidatus Staskawiczbacteria bacterium RIFCSPLOWO2_01_FULL_38_12b TaxID=1802214 RepID=A0A1G2IG07_9BACT|nr:MAG: hypothetical protein A2908_00375 [Candidatus Staskawiczbacteria bacterium RIFCSPLOWO2_01_FULL_38_12b]